jgi:hypothetical protein
MKSLKNELVVMKIDQGFSLMRVSQRRALLAQLTETARLKNEIESFQKSAFWW